MIGPSGRPLPHSVVRRRVTLHHGAVPTALLAFAVVSTGLFAGYFLSFMSGVMPGLRRVSDEQFATAMRRFNEKVPGPVFLLIFLGAVAFPLASWLVPVDDRTDTQGTLLLAGLACSVLGHLVTIGGNVPLNNVLAASEGRGDERAARAAFEGRWTALHALRTLLAVAAFALVTAAAL